MSLSTFLLTSARSFEMASREELLTALSKTFFITYRFASMLTFIVAVSEITLTLPCTINFLAYSAEIYLYVINCYFVLQLEGYTPLHLAFMSDTPMMLLKYGDDERTQAVEILLKYGADVHKKAKV